MQCSKCRWQNTCYSDPEVWDLSPKEHSLFLEAHTRCISEALGQIGVVKPEDILMCSGCDYQGSCGGVEKCLYVG